MHWCYSAPPILFSDSNGSIAFDVVDYFLVLEIPLLLSLWGSTFSWIFVKLPRYSSAACFSCRIPNMPHFCRFYCRLFPLSFYTFTLDDLILSYDSHPTPSTHECWWYPVLPSPLQTHLISCPLAVSVSIDTSHSHIQGWAHHSHSVSHCSSSYIPLLCERHVIHLVDHPWILQLPPSIGLSKNHKNIHGRNTKKTKPGCQKIIFKKFSA